MKKLLLLFFVILSFTVFSQSYNNSWIDYNKTYYKFKVGSTGLYRISQTNLNAIGLGNASAEQFQLWRNGSQVMLYTSSPTGALGSAGYIEFWGLMNDGTKDKQLYLNPDYQLSDHWSLETDTASYFLTINSSSNLRYTNAPNNVAGNTLAPEPYFMNTTGTYYKNIINPGYAIPVGGFYVYSSSYDIGEGYSSAEIYPGANLSLQLDSLNLYSAGPPASLRFGASGNASNVRNVQVKLNNNVVVDQSMPYFSYLKKQVDNIPLSVFTSPDVLNVQVQNVSSVQTDRIVVSFVEINYPSKFNFNNKANFYFELPASSNGNYLVITNFNYGTTAPVLLDMNTGKRYTADISTPGKVKIVLPPSFDEVRKFVLVNEEASNVKPVNNFKQINFINYANTSNQANYLIISNTALFNNGSGINYVDQYRAYRASAAGGGFNAKIYDIDQLTDQFAFGIKHHPLAVKDFIQYAKNNFADTPRFVFLIGKGVTYNTYALNENDPLSEKIELVPTYGFPASDNLLASSYGSIVPDVPVGRLSVVNGNEIANYLKKMQQYEEAQASTSQTVADKAWMKNVVHVIGGKDSSESYLFNFYMDRYKAIIQDTFYGAKVETFSKSSAAAVQILAGKRIEELFNEGISLLSYFGHSSANTLEFNLNSPETYHNQGKYPFFNVSGCTAGDNYIYEDSRLTGNTSLSEKYILADQRGSIGFLASSHLGIPPLLDNYNYELYKNIGITNYGKPIGVDISNTIKNLGGASPGLDFFTRMHLEEINLHGDPALKINPHEKPDYVIEEPMVKINPSIISVADNSFDLTVKILNIGKAINDSIRISVTRKLPNDSVVVLYNQRVAAIKYGDSITITSIINPIIDKGLNTVTVTIDADNNVDEISELNNTVIKTFYIFEDEVRPVYPYNFSIVNKQNINFYSSTANPFAASRQVLMELDTTELFNSSFKQSLNKTSVGGVIQFNPTVSFTNGTVYYWRIGVTPASGPVVWNTSSFIYLEGSGLGWNQSHFYQHLKSTYTHITLDSASRQFTFPVKNIPIVSNNGNYPTSLEGESDYSLNIDGATYIKSTCNSRRLNFVIINPATLFPEKNAATGSPGRFGSDNPCNVNTEYQFGFDYGTVAGRLAIMKFMDSIPSGYYVIVKNVTPDPAAFPSLYLPYAQDWALDANIYGAGISLTDKLRNAGFATIDSFSRARSFTFAYRKNSNALFTPVFSMSSGIYEKSNFSFVVFGNESDGQILSPKFGPSKKWNSFHWRDKSLESPSTDSVSIQIFGIKNNNIADLLATVKAGDTTLDFINAQVYPNLQLKMFNNDSVNATPAQLLYWRIIADPVPEGAVAPNLSLKLKDTLDAGENLDLTIAFKNISDAAFDSLKIKFIVTDKNNVPHVIPLTKGKPLAADDTLMIRYTIDTKNFIGMNTLFVEVNPDNDQAEQYHFNNFIFKNFYVKGDNYNPLLDVTFDGVHILNRDIVSARPHIIVKLKDENKFLALNDTSLIKVQIRFPDGSLKAYKFDNDTLRFTAANLATGDNTATIDFTPLLPGDDEEYELIVSGKDASGNTAGQLDYHVSFRVISKPMISNLLNYPNPFTTSTAFVFTITGTQPPQNMRIQILTITGKIVREITKDELGPLHIGRNITEFKWDGTDAYGQRLANGVYLYRVLTNLNGKSLERYKSEDDNTDKYFTKGYGKMYLMK